MNEPSQEIVDDVAGHIIMNFMISSKLVNTLVIDTDTGEDLPDDNIALVHVWSANAAEQLNQLWKDMNDPPTLQAMIDKLRKEWNEEKRGT